MTRRGVQCGEHIVVSVYRRLPTSQWFWREVTDWFAGLSLHQDQDWWYECRDDWTFQGGAFVHQGQQIEFYFSNKNRALAALFKLTFA